MSEAVTQGAALTRGLILDAPSWSSGTSADRGRETVDDGEEAAEAADEVVVALLAEWVVVGGDGDGMPLR